MCLARENANADPMGNPGAGYYAPDTLSVIPPGAEVAFHGIYRAPDPGGTTVDVEIDGFGAVITTPIMAG
jgi:hypothetical protein